MLFTLEGGQKKVHREVAKVRKAEPLLQIIDKWGQHISKARFIKGLWPNEMKVILGRADEWCRNTNGPRAALQVRAGRRM